MQQPLNSLKCVVVGDGAVGEWRSDPFNPSMREIFYSIIIGWAGLNKAPRGD